jgi:hypothetical protein
VKRARAALFLTMALGAGTCLAHVPSERECREAAEFIYHAAQARDNGATRAFFVGRLEEDLAAIRAFPPYLRWFAQDAEDEALLRSAVAAVFDHPQSDDAHRAAFESRCMRLARQ